MPADALERPLPRPSDAAYVEARLLEALVEARLALRFLEEGLTRNAAGKAFQAWRALLAALLRLELERLKALVKTEEERRWLETTTAPRVPTAKMKSLARLLEEVGYANLDVKPREEAPAEVVALDVNENTVAVAKVSLLSTVDRVVSWNRQYINPAVYLIRTDFGRLAKRYETVRDRKLEELKQKYPFTGRDEEEKRQNVADTREYKKFARRLRERSRKETRVRQIAREMTKSPAVIITEELGKNPQEEMIGLEKKAKKGVKKKVGKRELRHRVKQTPFRKILRAVEDKAREAGSVVVYVSPYRNSKVCPIHFDLLKNGNGWHTLHCPCGHDVDRDHAAVLNMLWKITPKGAAKAVWWDLKDVKKRLEKGRGLVPKEAVRRKNPLVTWPVVYAVWTSLRALKAGDKWPAVLARAAPMTPAQGADEGGTRAPPRPRVTPALQGWEEVRMT